MKAADVWLVFFMDVVLIPVSVMSRLDDLFFFLVAVIVINAYPTSVGRMTLVLFNAVLFIVLQICQG